MQTVRSNIVPVGFAKSPSDVTGTGTGEGTDGIGTGTDTGVGTDGTETVTGTGVGTEGTETGTGTGVGEGAAGSVGIGVVTDGIVVVAVEEGKVDFSGILILSC